MWSKNLVDQKNTTLKIQAAPAQCMSHMFLLIDEYTVDYQKKKTKKKLGVFLSCYTFLGNQLLFLMLCQLRGPGPLWQLRRTNATIWMKNRRGRKSEMFKRKEPESENINQWLFSSLLPNPKKPFLLFTLYTCSL